uniref:G domain-containing protein n=1 Tax=Lepisosteus oculatus TaxID=7918 RepID=W5LVI5_LEPOC
MDFSCMQIRPWLFFETEMGNLSSTSESEPEPESESELDKPWREILWSKEEKERLMEEIRTLTPRYTEAKELRIMMTGQITAGKSSYINTIDSVFQGHLTSQALAGKDEHSFTKKFNPFRVEDRANGEGDGVLPFVIYDVMGIDKIVQSPDDFISVVKGHIKDGYKVSCTDNASPFHPITAFG